jgi:hypothetical protein
MTVETMIHYMLEEWGTEPMVINSGLCFAFARQLRDHMREYGIWGEVHNSDILAPADETLPGHAFYTFDGRHYDAEAPEGVEDWRQLPIFLRAVDAERDTQPPA